MTLQRFLTRLSTARPATLSAGASCLGLCLLGSPATCTESERRRRKRPPKFGTLIPSITTRGISTSRINTNEMMSDRDDCPMCKKFGSGPCGDVFKRWLDCTDDNPGNDDNGEPMHLSQCSDLAAKLSKCLDDHQEYYIRYDDENKHEISKDENDELKEAWSEFVTETEDQINAHVYKLEEFPAEIAPTIQVRLESNSGAAYFKNKNLDGAAIIVAYIMDDKGSVLAAGSKEDMDMGEFGCILQFDLSTSMKSATCRAIYQEVDDSVVTVLSKTVFVPGACK